jgi:hypothetical protein
MKLEFSQQIFEKYKYIKFHENLSSGERVVPCGETDRRTGMTKLIVASRNFANAPKHYLTDNMSIEYIRAHIRKTEVIKCWKMDLTNTDDGQVSEKVRDIRPVLGTSITREVK